MMPDSPYTEMNDSNNKTASICMFQVFPLKILKNVCFPSDVLQSAGGEPGSQGQAAGDGAAPQPKQSGAGATPTGSAGLLLLCAFVCVGI